MSLRWLNWTIKNVLLSDFLWTTHSFTKPTSDDPNLPKNHRFSALNFKSACRYVYDYDFSIFNNILSSFSILQKSPFIPIILLISNFFSYLYLVCFIKQLSFWCTDPLHKFCNKLSNELSNSLRNSLLPEQQNKQGP